MPYRRLLQRLRRDKVALIGAALLAVLIAAAIVGPAFSPYDPITMNLPERLQSSSPDHWLGTDGFGRDVASRILHGARLSLGMAFTVTFTTALMGIFIGGIAGYVGGVVDETLMRLVDILLAFPNLILSLVIVAVLGPSLQNLLIALILTGWVSYARIIRGITLSIKERDFIIAARLLGCTDWQIFTRHLIPNVLSPVLVLATLDVGHTILSISTLSFLGLGAQPPTPEWGAMLNEGRPYLQNAPHLMLTAGGMIMLTVAAFNFAGDGLRDALDPLSS